MKLKSSSILSILLLIYSMSFSQITLRGEDIIENAVIKPKTLDSLSNIHQQKEIINYKQYIGYKLFFTPLSKKYIITSPPDSIINYLFTNQEQKLDRIEDKQSRQDITNIYRPIFQPAVSNSSGSSFVLKGYKSDPTYCYGQYFTILDVQAKENSWSKNNYVALEEAKEKNFDKSHIYLKFILKNDLNDDTLYWNVAGSYIHNQFMLVPYFVKIKNAYQNQHLIAVKQITDKVDIKTGEPIVIKTGEKWTCTDVSFVDTKTNNRMVPYLFLKNGEREIIMGFDDVHPHNESNFILESTYLKNEADRKKQAEQKILERQDQEKKEQADKARLKAELIRDYGTTNGTYIADGKVVIGMKKEICRLSWGPPIRINETITANGIREQWVYGWGTYLYFHNGLLTSIQR